jgi:hypothetical protein
MSSGRFGDVVVNKAAVHVADSNAKEGVVAFPVAEEEYSH